MDEPVQSANERMEMGKQAQKKGEELCNKGEAEGSDTMKRVEAQEAKEKGQQLKATAADAGEHAKEKGETVEAAQKAMQTDEAGKTMQRAGDDPEAVDKAAEANDNSHKAAEEEEEEQQQQEQRVSIPVTQQQAAMARQILKLVHSGSSDDSIEQGFGGEWEEIHAGRDFSWSRGRPVVGEATKHSDTLSYAGLLAELWRVERRSDDVVFRLYDTVSLREEHRPRDGFRGCIVLFLARRYRQKSRKVELLLIDEQTLEEHVVFPSYLEDNLGICTQPSVLDVSLPMASRHLRV